MSNERENLNFDENFRDGLRNDSCREERFEDRCECDRDRDRDCDRNRERRESPTDRLCRTVRESERRSGRVIG